MKTLERAKTIQLLVFLAIAGVCFYLIVAKSNVYHLITQSKELQLVCALLWASLFTAFIFIFIDFSLYSKQKKEYNALDYAVHSDALAKIANRQGIDEIIDNYVDRPLPMNMGCAMFILTSLNEINKHHTRAEGNTQIRNFSIILKLASTDVCFVGRNGGNVFMAIFENASSLQVEAVLDRIAEKVKEYNRKKDSIPMYYQMGLAYHENSDIATINELISLANKRAHAAEPFPNNITIFSKQTKEHTAKQKTSKGQIRDINDYRYSDDEKYGKHKGDYKSYYEEAKSLVKRA